MKRALGLALAGVAVVLIAVFFAMRGAPTGAATPTARLESDRSNESATLTPLMVSDGDFRPDANDSRVAIDVGDSIDIHGRVVDELGRPIETYAVRAIHRDANNRFVDVRELPLAAHENGAFELLGLEPGYWDVLPFADDLSQPFIRSFARSPDERVEFVMTGNASISGVVLDPDQQPAANATILVDQSSTRASADGTFRIEVKPGIHQVHAEAQGFALSDAREIQVGTRDHIEGMQLTLKRGALLRVLVLDETDKPWSGLSVRVTGPRTPTARATSDERGRLELSVGEPEDLSVVALEGSDGTGFFRNRYTATLVASNVATGSVTLRKARERDVRVRGSLGSSARSSANSGALITANALDRRLIRNTTPSGEVDSNGNFAVTLPAPGRYRFALTDGIELGSQIVDIPDGDEFELSLKFD